TVMNPLRLINNKIIGFKGDIMQLNEYFTGTLTLIKLSLRRDRIIIPIFIIFILIVILGTVATFVNLYSDPMSRYLFYVQTQNSPSLIILLGSILDQSIGGLTAWRTGIAGPLIIGLINIFLLVRHTRSEERRGRLELLVSTSLGRQSPLTSALLTNFILDILISVLIAIGLIGFGLDETSSLVLGLSIGIFGILFTSITAIAVQLTESSNNARYLSVSLLIGFYILRMIGWDNGNVIWLSWLSPYGWVHYLSAFAGNDIWVFGLFIVSIIILTIIAYWLSSIRDVGSGVITKRTGHKNAAKTLRSSLALTWRLQRNMFIFWLTVLTLFGAINGALALTATNLISANPLFLKLIYHAGYTSPVDNYFAISLGLFAIVFSVYAILATMNLRTEESERYSDMLLTNSVSRNSWIFNNLIFGFIAPAFIMIIFSLAMALAYGYSANISYDPTKLLIATLAYLPAIWILTGLTVLLFGLKPRLTSLSWAVLGLFLIVSLLGEFSNINQNILNLSPFTQVPNILIGNSITTNLVWVFIIGIALTIIGLYSYNHRDING
ncbi:MAG: hypothetical protein WCE60_07315, partial [Methanobacterium sp.]